MQPMSESIISKVGFWQGLIVAGLSIFVTVSTVFLFFGGAFQRLNQVEKDTEQNKQEIQTFKADIDGRLQRIEERMIDKDDFRELKADVKDLLKRR